MTKEGALDITAPSSIATSLGIGGYITSNGEALGVVGKSVFNGETSISTSLGIGGYNTSNGEVLGVNGKSMFNGETYITKLAVGTTSRLWGPNAKLVVDGTIGCRELMVTLDNFPDYVFEKGYKLKSLIDLEEFVVKNKHLPGIPSASDIEQRQGQVGLGEMNKLLLEKIEELTLYSISQQKSIDSQSSIIEKLENRLKLLEEKQ